VSVFVLSVVIMLDGKRISESCVILYL